MYLYIFDILIISGWKYEKYKKISIPKGFFTKSRPHATKQDEDYIPFVKNVLNGKSKAKIVSLKRKNIG